MNDPRDITKSLVDILTGSGFPVLTASTMPTATYQIKRLSQLAGRPVEFRLRGLPYGRCRDIARLKGDPDINILLEGCVEPDLTDQRLQDVYGGPTPAEAVQHMLLPGEISELSLAIEQLSGYRTTTINEVKNA